MAGFTLLERVYMHGSTSPQQAIPMKIAIINVWGRNRGDEAQQRSLIFNLWNLYPEMEIMCFHHDASDLPERVIQRSIDLFPISLRLLPFHLYYYRNPYTVYLCCRRLLRSESWNIRRNLMRMYEDRMEAKRFLNACSLIISGPAGPYIGNTYPEHDLPCLLRIRTAALLGKHCVITATSAGGFAATPWANRIRRLLLRNVDWWTLREPVSSLAVECLRLPNAQVELAADLVFSRVVTEEKCDIQSWERHELSDLTAFAQSPTIGVTINTTPFMYEDGRIERVKDNIYMEQMTTFLRSVSVVSRSQLLFFPHHCGYEREMKIIFQIAKALGPDVPLRIVSPYLNSDSQQLLIKHLQAYISHRYHPGIFALQNGIPVFYIVHQFKTKGLLDIFEYPLDMPTTVSGQKSWQERFGMFWSQREILRSHIASKLPRVRDLSRITIQRLAETLRTVV